MEDKDDLTKAIKELIFYEKRQTSIGWIFLRGVAYGLGFFIGSAILATVVILLLSKIEGLGIIGGTVHQIIEAVKKPK